MTWNRYGPFFTEWEIFGLIEFESLRRIDRAR